MTDYSKFKRGADFTGWLRAPQADKFVSQLESELLTLSINLSGACATSTDVRVREAHARLEELKTLVNFLRNSRKESREDDE